MAIQTARAPGEWVLARALRQERRIWIGIGVFFGLIAGVLLAAFTGHRLLGTAGGLLVVLASVALRRRAEGYVDEHLRWLAGGRAEQSVGRELEELRREGWIVLHDIQPAGKRNVDHVTSGPGGVFVIETKTSAYLDHHLGIVKQQAAHLNRHLGVWVTPVICIERRAGNPFKHHGVWIVPRKSLRAWLLEQRNQTLPFEQFGRYVESS
jgi:nuclease-like protein